MDIGRWAQADAAAIDWAKRSEGRSWLQRRQLRWREGREARMMLVLLEAELRRERDKFRVRIAELEAEVETKTRELEAKTRELEAKTQELDRESLEFDRVTTCVVCLAAPRVRVAMPCGHLCACDECTGMCDKRCPMCRKPVKKYQKVFM